MSYRGKITFFIENNKYHHIVISMSMLILPSV